MDKSEKGGFRGGGIHQMDSAIRLLGRSDLEKQPRNGKKKGTWAKTQVPCGKWMVGPERLELSTFCPPDKRANQAALRSDVFDNLPNIAMLDGFSSVSGQNCQEYGGNCKSCA